MTVWQWGGQVFRELPLLTRALFIGWLLEMVSVPILKWRGGERALRAGVVAGVVLQALTVVLLLSQMWTWRQTLSVTLSIVMMAWVVEFIGSHTGFPFGRYHYTQHLQPHVGGVPWVIPLAWLMMLPPAWGTAQLIIGSKQGQWWFPCASGLAFTAWDLFLDPQMVRWNLWHWAPASKTKTGRPRRRYFGIPWSNFVGWWLTACGITALIGPSKLPIAPLFLIYGLTWALESVGQLVFWRWPGPAVGGFIGMGVFVIGAWLGGLA